MTKFYIPTKQDILDLEIGSMAPDFTGKFKPIVEITAKKQDVNGKWFCCYYVPFGNSGDGSKVSHSLKEDELDRNVKASIDYNSAQLDNIEKMLKERN